MSYIRFDICLAVKEPLPKALKDKLPKIREAIQLLKSYSSKINEGEVNEEDTTRAKWHRCHHDTGQSCEPSEDI